MTAIRIENLTKTFGMVRALDGLNLTVEEGEIFGFLGPNGAGKTTTIRLLTGLAHPTAGQAWVAELPIGKDHQAASKIGYLPEEPTFYPYFSPLEYLDHIGRLFNLPPVERRKRIDELLELTGLAQVKKRRIGGFSRGMRQRMGLAQALINQPQVLLLDEPVSALDPIGRKEILELIERLRGQCTIFMSTHILADVERVCDSVGIIHKGRLLVKSNKNELLERYALPVLEVECDSGQAESLAPWLKELTAQPWVKSTALNQNVARIIVATVEADRQKLLAAALQAGLALRRFEVVTPSLEDVFLQLVNDAEQTS
jgi:ABC-2 type transport system ATP-binding protein